MKRITTLFLSLFICLMASAQVGTPTPANGDIIMPKPAFTINYNSAVAALQSESARYDLRGKISITDNNGKSYSYAIGTVTATSINFVLQDLEVLPANATITVKLDASIGGQTFTYTVEDYYTLEKGATAFAFASSKKNTLRIGEGVKLLVDKTLKCKQLIVEPNAGITIASTGSLEVYDTAFFLPNIGEIEGMPFLINKGSYSAAGTVFMRDLPSAEQMYELSSPVKSFSAYEYTLFDIEDHEYSDIEWGDITQKKYFWNGWRNAVTWDWYDYDETTKLKTNITYDWPFYVYPYFNNMVLRMKGNLNNSDEYLIEKESIGQYVDGQHTETAQLTKLVNVYPSAIDVRKMYEDGRIDVNNVYVKQNLDRINDEYVYNLNSGLTTYDGPMSYGYLLPNLTNASDYTKSKIVATEKIEDQATKDIVRLRYSEYSEEKEKYVDPTPKYPYIRFYCNYVNNPIEKGKRSVCVVYFVEDEVEQAEMRTDVNESFGSDAAGGNVKYDAVFSTEYLFDDDYSYTYPYIVAKKLPQDYKGRLSIASYNYPTEENEVEVKIGLMAKKGVSDKMEVGILDYYLPGIIFENADDEADDLLISRSNKKVQCDITEGSTADDFIESCLFFTGNGVHTERTFTLRFRLPKDGEEAPATDESLFEDIDATVTESDFAASGAEIEPIVASKTYSVTIADVDNATITADQTTEIKAGETVTITALPADGYKVTSLVANGGDVEIDAFGQFVMPKTDVTINATVEPVSGLAVTTVTDGNGMVAVSNTDAQYGETITITTDANVGYVLDKITTEPELEISTDNQFTMPNSAVTVTATFKAIDYTITVGTADNGSIAVSKTTANVGDEISITITPDEDYRLGLLMFSDGKTVADEYYTFTMPATDLTITPLFTEVDDKSVIALVESGEGKVAVSANDAEEGETIMITTKAAEGYELSNLVANYVDGGEIEITNNSFTMPNANVIVKASFKLVDYTISVADVTNGTLVADKAVANMGDEVTLTATPAEGYEVETFTVDGVAIDGATFIMPAHNVVIGATFKIADYTISLVKPENGTATVDKATANVGDVVTITATPDENYELLSISVNDVAIEENSFTMPAADVAVKVLFKAIDYTITVGTADNGSIAVSKTTANVGDVVTITATPDEGYELSSITVNDVAIEGTTFTMPAENVKIEATFTYTYVCKEIKEENIAKSLFDWVLVVNNKRLNNDGYTFDDNAINWYKVVGDRDEWCTGEGQDDELIATGLYYTGDNILSGQGNIYVVIKLTKPEGKYLVSPDDKFDYSGSKSLRLTPTSVRPGQTLNLTGLPTNENTYIKVFNISGTTVKTIKTNGDTVVSFQAEDANGIYIVKVYVDEYAEDFKYIVVK